MVSDNHNNESFNLIKYIVLILISISIGLLIATLHNREIIFASQNGYSFGVIDVEGELVQSDPYNGNLHDAFYYNFYNVYSNYLHLNLPNNSILSRNDFYSLLDTVLDSSSNNAFDTMFEMGYFPNICVSEHNILYILWSYPYGVGALTFDNNDVPFIKFSSYPAFIGSIPLNQDTQYSSTLSSNVSSGTFMPSSYRPINQIYTTGAYFTFNLPVIFNFGNINNISYNLFNYFTVSGNHYGITIIDPSYSGSASVAPLDLVTTGDVILCSYPYYILYSGSTPLSETLIINSFNYAIISWPNYDSTLSMSVGIDPRTLFWFSEIEFNPLFPTPTPIPTALPTITPTPLPLAFDSTIDGMEDGTTLGFLESLSDGFDALISTFTVIPFFSVSISYLYNYSPWFRLLFFVPIVAFLSFLIGRNKS